MGDEHETPAPLDRADLDQVSLGDVEFERDLLHDFLAGSATLFASLAQAVAAGDRERVRHAAHSLKGSCWAVGARPLGGACERLELDACAGKLDAASQLLGEIRHQLSRVDAYVRRHWSL